MSISEKLDYVQEIADSLVNARENNIKDLSPDDIFKISIDDFPILKEVLKDVKEDFRKIIRQALIKAYIRLNFEEEDVAEIEKAVNEFKKVQIEIHIPKTINMREINAEEHERKIITFPCEVYSVPDKSNTITTKVLWKCYSCGDEFILPSGERKISCSSCKKKVYNSGIAETASIQSITLREMSDESIYSSKHRIMAEIHGEYVGHIEMGQKKMVTGLFKSLPPKTVSKTRIAKNDIIIDVINIENLDDDKTKIPDDLSLQMYKDLATSHKLIPKLIDSYAWHIKGNDDAKLAILLALVGGITEQNYRGRIHILFVGDPSTAKTEIAKWIILISPKSTITDGTGSTDVGLMVAMVKMPDGTMAWTPGPVALNHKGHVLIDEIDKAKMDFGMLLGVMEDGKIRRSVAGGAEIELPAETTIIACANPIGGTWNREHPEISTNIDLPPYLMARFDLMFRFLRTTDEEEVLGITKHIKQSRKGRPKETFSEEQLTELLNYCRQQTPTLPEEIEDIIIKFYVKIVKNSDENVVLDMRQYHGIVRLSHAFAKLLFKKEVDEECVELAINLYKRSIETFGISLEEGKSLAEGSSDMTRYSGTKEEVFRNVFNNLDKKEGIVFIDDLIADLRKSKHWKSDDKANDYIELLHNKGKLTINNNRVAMV